MERNDISIQEARVYLTLKRHDGWLTNIEITQATDGVSPRTVRAVTNKLAKLQLLDVAELWPGHRYRLAAGAAKRNNGYTSRLESALDVFGLQAQLKRLT